MTARWAILAGGLIGVLIAPVHIHPFAAALAVIAIALGSGAAGAVNMWYERDLDALMARTRNRPLPAGRVAPDDALGLGVLLSIFSVLLMAVATNFVAAALLASAILFYVFVYTIWLKRRTPQNIVIGGAAGAFPPVIGWAAATGDVAITDGTGGSGLATDATARLGGRRIRVGADAAHLDDGTLAGSTLTMDRAFCSIATVLGCSVVDAAIMCSTTPARALGLPGVGVIAEGAMATHRRTATSG